MKVDLVITWKLLQLLQNTARECIMAIVCLIILTIITVTGAQFRLQDVPGNSPVDPSGSQLLEIRVINPSPPPRTRKLHPHPQNINTIEQNPPGNIVKIFLGPTPSRKPPSNNHRGYKSKCKCEKIWKCHKMQQSIGRCPSDHFMCCS